MRFLGVDYGAKRIGLAVADAENRMATPLRTLAAAGKSPQKNAAEIAAIVRAQAITTVVIGESKDFSGTDNTIMKEIREFAATLATDVGESAQIIFEPEFLTTRQAEHLQGKHDLIDASAAALILQSHLDRQ